MSERAARLVRMKPSLELAVCGAVAVHLAERPPSSSPDPSSFPDQGKFLDPILGYSRVFGAARALQ